MVVLKKRVLNTLYLWIASRLCHLGVSTSVDFRNLLAVLPFRGTLVYFPCIRVAPLCAFLLNLKLLIKKKKKIL
jgi:hypothetical protein